MNQPEPTGNPINSGGEANTVVDVRVAQVVDAMGWMLSEGSKEDILAAMTTLAELGTRRS